MTNPEILNENQNKKTKLNNIDKFTKENTEQFNSYKYKHFNYFFCNIINEQLKLHQKNDLSNKYDNNSNLITKNEHSNKKLYLDYTNNNNIYNVKNKFLTKEKSKENNITNKNILNSNYKNQKKSFPKINKKYISQGQNTIPYILQNQTEKPKNIIHSRNISFIQNEYINKTIKEEIKNYSNTSDFNYIYKNKNQQLPKDAINGLLLFLKKNKNHLARTSKYYNIYKEYKDYIDEGFNTSNNFNENKNNKLNNKNVNVGYYGRKPLDGVDIYDTTSTYGYNYSNKSEKSRHELIIAELNRLKGYIEKNKNEKELFIKDFLNKHNISCEDKSKLDIFEKFLRNFNKNYNLLKPSLGIKEMILNIFEEGEKINLIDKPNKTNETNEPKIFINSLSTNNLQSSSNINNNNTNLKPYETNINLTNSPSTLNQKYTISEEKNTNTKKNNNKSLTENKNIKNIKKFDLYETNSYLKQVQKQSRIHYPNKNYSTNYNLIIKDIGNELEQLSLIIKTEKKYKNKPIIKKDNKKNLNNFNFNFITQNSNKSIDDIFITSNKTFSPNNDKNRGEKNNNKIFKANNTNYKTKMKIVKRGRNKNIFLDENKSNKHVRKNDKKMTQIILNKLNLKPKIQNIEIEDVKKRLKLTEYIVYNNAKRKIIFDELGKNELYECKNKGTKHKNLKCVNYDVI